jgi:hypothetical protein
MPLVMKLAARRALMAPRKTAPEAEDSGRAGGREGGSSRAREK